VDKFYSKKMAQVQAYGTWTSPITSDVVVSDGLQFTDLLADPHDGHVLFWTESRPTEAGRQVLVKCTIDGEQQDLFPRYDTTSAAFYSSRTRVHEYGGGASMIDASGNIFFTNFKDQGLYKASDLQQIATKEKTRHADGFFDGKRNRLVMVREDHSVIGENRSEPENLIVSIRPTTVKEEQEEIVLARGFDFYAFPRLNADGSKLCYVCWSHPNMPWDCSSIFTVDLDENGQPIESTRTKISKTDEESCSQPCFSPDGRYLFYTTDYLTGYWNLYRYKFETGELENLMVNHKKVEIGGPLWVLGKYSYQLIDSDNFVCTFDGKLYVVRSGEWTTVESVFSTFKSLVLSADRKKIFFIGSSPTLPTAVSYLDLDTLKVTEIKKAFKNLIPSGYFSLPESIEYPTTKGTAYAYFYPPKNQDFVAPENEKPPIITFIHGGPTASVSLDLSYKIQYWTSRGFGVLNVDYGGSTGYGREYRLKLYKEWGIVDVDDACNGALYLVKTGRADRNRLCISGGSAGGYTVLACLCFRDVFSAGASHYGVADLIALATDTHKFESRYLDKLIGKYPEEKQIYIDRSPINSVNNLKVPLAIFQGDEDAIVPPNQSEMMYEAVKKKGIPVSYTLFAGEQHGFRKAENIKRCLDGEFYFYSKVFGFHLPQNHPADIKIVNL